MLHITTPLVLFTIFVVILFIYLLVLVGILTLRLARANRTIMMITNEIDNPDQTMIKTKIMIQSILSVHFDKSKSKNKTDETHN